MRRALKVGLLLWWFCARIACAQWTVESAERRDAGRAGAIHFEIQVANSESGDQATLHFAVFPTKTATLRVIDDPAERHANLAATMQREKCIAGVNGGYFDPENAPVGLLIADGRLVARASTARLLSGVVSAGAGRIRIQRAAEFSTKTKPAAARQCGPFLVDAGKPIAGLNDTRTARRTFVFTSGADRAAFGYCTHVTLAQMAVILATPGLVADLKIDRALNMDGGSSSAFWFAGENGAFSIREQKSVRDYLAIVPR